jgi:hypothetical protein
MVNTHKLRYLAASKVDKPMVARQVVQMWRNQNPEGRFLGKSPEEGGGWVDVGDQKAREKASQCLRERTPDIQPFLKTANGNGSSTATPPANTNANPIASAQPGHIQADVPHSASASPPLGYIPNHTASMMDMHMVSQSRMMLQLAQEQQQAQQQQQQHQQQQHQQQQQ